MKLVKAYIRPMLLEDVYMALRKEGYCCMTVLEGEGTGRYSDPESTRISKLSGHAYACSEN